MAKSQINQLRDINQRDIVVLGICSDHNSSFMRGPAGAPPKIREALYCGAANLSSELGVSIRDNARFKDIGDFHIGETEADYLSIAEPIQNVLSQGGLPLSLGGDHAVTYPILKAIANSYQNVNILHFDAHLDIYPEFEGNRYSHACPFARIMESKLASRLIQVGIRTLNQTQQLQVDKYNVEVHQMKDFDVSRLSLNLEAPLYISVDIDALDPAFAPGVSHFEPGGMNVRDIITIIQSINVPIIGADIVEFNPTRDINGMTAMVAAKILKELAGAMLLNS
ncbi:agmatinase [Aliikangiella marina]|uniref:Agmatinase n=1 Tax=Aliikangiella marina TaxID=1712262 RepID=A0A545TDU8_9GAMM|nr:agmatinase [Aliikangiella marina]TQV75395.1 agmatinase [Aliikangiella marina]